MNGCDSNNSEGNRCNKKVTATVFIQGVKIPVCSIHAKEAKEKGYAVTDRKEGVEI
jgi:hypothetical protein